MCERIFTHTIDNKIPIIMLTAEFSVGMRERGKKCGVKVWIPKPFEEEKVLAVARKNLEAV